MDAYQYEAALFCGACMLERLIRQGKAAPGARGMAPAEALEQITESNGFTCESDYDSDDLPKGPHSDGGGEADCPQSCDSCHAFLRNPLTDDGAAYLRETLAPWIARLDVQDWTQGAFAEFVAAKLDAMREASDAAPVLPGMDAPRAPGAALAEWARFYAYVLDDMGEELEAA